VCNRLQSVAPTHHDTDGVAVGAPRQRNILAVLLGTARRAAQRGQLARRPCGPDAEHGACEGGEAAAVRQRSQRQQRLRGGWWGSAIRCGGMCRIGHAEAGREVQALGDARRPVQDGGRREVKRGDVVGRQALQAREAECEARARPCASRCSHALLE
jgi:hypothetical protein